MNHFECHASVSTVKMIHSDLESAEECEALSDTRTQVGLLSYTASDMGAPQHNRDRFLTTRIPIYFHYPP